MWNKALKSRHEHKFEIWSWLFLCISAVIWLWLAFLTSPSPLSSSSAFTGSKLHRLIIFTERGAIIVLVLLLPIMSFHVVSLIKYLLLLRRSERVSSPSISQLLKTNICFKTKVHNFSFSFHPIWIISIFHIEHIDRVNILIWTAKKSKNKQAVLNSFSPLTSQNRPLSLERMGHY